MLGNKKIMGDNIQYYLGKHGIERKEFAKIIGVPYSTLTCWINGTAYPRIDKIQKMADFFGIEKADLVEERTPKLTAMSLIMADAELQKLVEAYHSADSSTKGIIKKILDMKEV